MSFIVFLNVISGVTIALAVGVNLFPTNYRGMGTSFVMLCGRVGGFSGSILIGLLLADMCSVIFYLYGALLISENNISYCLIIIQNSEAPVYTIRVFFLILGCIFIFISIKTSSSTNKWAKIERKHLETSTLWCVDMYWQQVAGIVTLRH